MAAGSTIPPVDEYVSTTYRPNCDYIDGVLRQKPTPTRKHGRIQSWLVVLTERGFPEFEAATEVTVRIRENLYLIPGLVVQRRDRIQDPYPTEPVHLCVEVLSPDDRISEVFAKCEEYHAWGVATTWIVDPETLRGWVYRKGERPHEVAESGSLTAEGIVISAAELFSVLK
jgi:Uma2 family endonuclease